ncbi:MAG: hypothetical protein U9N84_09555 [Actinomycetota bacterium]|nr:hypothetical protein [Actinomycetota bacterium]
MTVDTHNPKPDTKPNSGATPAAATPPSVTKHDRLPGPATYLVLAAWVGAVMAAISAGAFAEGGDPPLPLMASVALPIAAVAASYRWSRQFREYVLALDTGLILAAQLWRVVGAAFLFAYAFDQLPAGFAIPAGVGDVVTGLAALGVVVAHGSGKLTRRRLYLFTVLGVGDFLVAIIAGLTIRPPELDLWPLIIFPTLMVPFFGVLHLIAVLQSRNTG